MFPLVKATDLDTQRRLSLGRDPPEAMHVICRLYWYRIGAAGCTFSLTVAELKAASHER